MADYVEKINNLIYGQLYQSLNHIWFCFNILQFFSQIYVLICSV